MKTNANGVEYKITRDGATFTVVTSSWYMSGFATNKCAERFASTLRRYGK